MKNHNAVIPHGGWWNSRGAGGPDEWHYIERKRMGGGIYWTLCERHFTMRKPRALHGRLGTLRPVCGVCAMHAARSDVRRSVPKCLYL